MGLCPIKPYIYKLNGATETDHLVKRVGLPTGGFLVFLPSPLHPHNSPPPKKADNTVPSKAWTEVQDAEGWDHGFHPSWANPRWSERYRENRNVATMLQQPFIKKKLGRPACLHVSMPIFGVAGRHISRTHPPSRYPDLVPLKVTCHANDGHWDIWTILFCQGRMKRFQPGKTMAVKKSRLFIQWMGWWGSLNSLGRDKPSDSRMHIHGSTRVRFSFQFSKYSNDFESQSFSAAPTYCCLEVASLWVTGCVCQRHGGGQPTPPRKSFFCPVN